MFLDLFPYFPICKSALPFMKIKLPAFEHGITHQKRQAFCILKRPNNKLTRSQKITWGSKRNFLKEVANVFFEHPVCKKRVQKFYSVPKRNQ
jgi:hypothetical protein